MKKIKESTKITLTLGQLKRLVKENYYDISDDILNYGREDNVEHMTLADIYDKQPLPATFKHEVKLTPDYIKRGILESDFSEDEWNVVEIIDWRLAGFDDLIPSEKLSNINVRVEYRCKYEGEIISDRTFITISIDPMDIKDEFCSMVRNLNLAADGPMPDAKVDNALIDKTIREKAVDALFIVGCELDQKDPCKLIFEIGYDPIHECDFLDDVVEQYWDIAGATYD